MKCVSCDHEMFLPDATVIDSGGFSDRDSTLQLELSDKPNALFGRNSVKVGVFAKVCGSCGHTMLFVPGSQLKIINEKFQK